MLHKKLMYIILVTFLCVHSSRGVDNLSKDEDIFLEDEGSGGGYWSRYDTESHSSGLGPDDDDSYAGSYGNTHNTHTNNFNFDLDLEPPISGGPDLHSQDTNTNDKTSFLDPYSETDFGHTVNNRDRDDNLFNKKPEGTASFFSQPGILAAIICGAIVGLLCAILLVMFIVYRMRKKDEGSYVLDDSKRTVGSYGKAKEFFA